MLRVADNEPRSAANNTIVIGQLCPGASERPHQLTEVKLPRSVPGSGLTNTLEINTGAVPVLVSVTVLYWEIELTDRAEGKAGGSHAQLRGCRVDYDPAILRDRARGGPRGILDLRHEKIEPLGRSGCGR